MATVHSHQKGGGGMESEADPMVHLPTAARGAGSQAATAVDG